MNDCRLTRLLLEDDLHAFSESKSANHIHVYRI